MKKLKIATNFIIFTLSFLSLFICYDCVAKGVTSGLYLCADVIIPSLFPTLCVTSFFANSGVISTLSKHCHKFCKKVFNMSGYFLPVFLISLVSSYPVGATLSNQLYENKKISLDERNNMSTVCCSAGPAFITLAVGVGILHSFSCGILLLVCHILSSITVAIIISRFFKFNYFFNKNAEEDYSIGDALVLGINNACSSIISICGYTILFSAVVTVISKYLRFSSFFLPIVAMLEVTNAVYTVASQNLSLAIISAVLGFGGFSVIFQISSLLKNNRPPLSNIIIARLFHSLLSFIYCSISLKFVDISIPVLKNITPVFSFTSENFFFSVALIMLLVVFLCYCNKFLKQEN